MDRERILLQLDTDDHPSVFDSIVAIDSGEVQRLLSHHNVTRHNVRSLVHGAMFTRSADELRETAIFIGGTDVAAAEAVLEEVVRTFFGPLRVAVMIDPSGANTTAAAAVVAATKHMKLAGKQGLVLGATGPVGQRVVRLLALEKAKLRVASRTLERSKGVCATVAKKVDDAELEPVSTTAPEELKKALQGVEFVIAAGAAGIELLPSAVREETETLQLAIDLNAVPPLGIGGIEVSDRGVDRGGVKCYGALGVGAIKMRLHKLAIKLLYDRRDQVLDAEELYEIGRGL
jgi:hypothetical protein